MVFYIFRIIYSESLVRHFEHCLRICSPYFKEKEEAFLQSEFGQMSCKDDFVKINNKLKEVAKLNKIDLPDFTIY